MSSTLTCHCFGHHFKIPSIKKIKHLKSILEVIFKSSLQSLQVSYGQNIKESIIFPHIIILAQIHV